MVVKKMSKKEWQRSVERAVRKRELEEAIEASINKKLRWKRIRHDLPVPLFIGIVACLLVYNFYGAGVLGEILLSWVIGLTFVSFLLSWFGIKKS